MSELLYAYESKPVSEQKVKDIQILREEFSDLHKLIEQLCPKSRHLSICLTDLEKACMFAVKSITHNGE